MYVVLITIHWNISKMVYCQIIPKKVKGASKIQKAELQKPFEWTWNMLNYFQSSIAQDLWPENRLGTSWLIRSRCMKFHDHRWITKSVRYGPETVFNHQWPRPWPLTSKSIRGTSLAHWEQVYEVSWSQVDYRVSYGLETVFNHYSPMTLTFDLLTLKSIGHIFD